MSNQKKTTKKLADLPKKSVPTKKASAIKGGYKQIPS